MSKRSRTGVVKEASVVWDMEHSASTQPQQIPGTTKNESLVTSCPNYTDIKFSSERAQSLRFPSPALAHGRHSADFTNTLLTPPLPGAKRVTVGSLVGGASTEVSQNSSTGQGTPSSNANPTTSGKALSLPPIAPKPRPEKRISQPTAMSLVPVGPKSNGKLQSANKESTQPGFLPPPLVGPRRSCHEQSPQLKRALSDSVMGKRKPPVSPKPQVHTKRQTAKPGNLSKRWSHQASSKAQGFTTGRTGPLPFQVKHKHITQHLDRLFGKIKPSALRAKWLKGWS